MPMETGGAKEIVGEGTGERGMRREEKGKERKVKEPVLVRVLQRDRTNSVCVCMCVNVL